MHKNYFIKSSRVCRGPTLQGLILILFSRRLPSQLRSEFGDIQLPLGFRLFFFFLYCDKSYIIQNILFQPQLTVHFRRRQWHPTPVLLPGKSHGWRSLIGGSPWGRTESDTTERLHFHFHELEKEMATQSSVLAWRIPGTGEPGGLPSIGSHRVDTKEVTQQQQHSFHMLAR